LVSAVALAQQEEDHAQCAEKLWTGLFLAILHFPVAAVISGLVGAQSGLIFWVMGIAAHQPVLLATTLSFRRRLAIWLTAMTVAGVTAGLGEVAISLITPTTAANALSASGRVTNAFWFVVTVRLVIRWAPVIVAGVVSGMLARRSSRGREGAPASLVSRIQYLEAQTAFTGGAESGIRAGGVSVGFPWTAFRIFAKTVVSVGVLFFLLLANDYLSDQAHVIGVATGWAFVILIYGPTLICVWGPARLRTPVLDWIRSWLPRDWRLVPFYAAAILVSIAALRYIFSD